MRKTFLLALGLAAFATTSMVGADAAVKTYWDQATGKWMKYDTNARKAAPLSPDAGNTTQMGKPQQTYRNANPVPRKTIDYSGPFKPNTIVVNTAERRLYYIMPNGKALRYGVGVGRDGFTWSGVETISRKAEWPGWTPPPEMVAREKKKGRILPAYMEGGINNPLGARALYIGGTLYRIHGTTEPWTIGTAVSSGCIRLTNDDVTHLYERVKVGTRVVVLRGDESPARLAALANPPPPKKEVLVAEARTKDDALESLGIGVVIAGTIPAEAASPETTASVVPSPAPAPEAAVEAPVVADVPEAVAKDDDVATALPPPVEVATEETPAGAEAPAVVETPVVDAPVVAVAPAVDDAAKDDVAPEAVAVVTSPASEPEDAAATVEPEQGDAAAVPVEAATPVVDTPAKASMPAPVAEPVAADPVAKDDGLATDLGGKAIPIDSSPKLPDDTAAANTLVKPAVVAN